MVVSTQFQFYYLIKISTLKSWKKQVDLLFQKTIPNAVFYTLNPVDCCLQEFIFLSFHNRKRFVLLFLSFEQMKIFIVLTLKGLHNILILYTTCKENYHYYFIIRYSDKSDLVFLLQKKMTLKIANNLTLVVFYVRGIFNNIMLKKYNIFFKILLPEIQWKKFLLWSQQTSM